MLEECVAIYVLTPYEWSDPPVL